MVNSMVGLPQGRGKIERFFETINECLLMNLPGYSLNGRTASRPALGLNTLQGLLEKFIVEQYHFQPHGTTGQAPVARWAYGFLPQLPASLEELDRLLLTVEKPRKVQRDGIQFQGLRYIAPTLAGFVGESVTLRYDPRDLAEIRVYYQDRFLCRAVCQDIAEMEITEGALSYPALSGDLTLLIATRCWSGISCPFKRILGRKGIIKSPRQLRILLNMLIFNVVIYNKMLFLIRFIAN
jgi:putative transposase